MGPRWLQVLGCVCVFLVLAHSAAVPTQDTLVVTKEDEATTSTPIGENSSEGTTSASVDIGSTTDGPNPPIKMSEMTVRSDVALRYAHTSVVTKVRNPAKKSQEATFRVLLPETAFISGFVMILDGKSYKAYVKEKEEAKQIYTDAVSHGIGAAHIAAKARDSNHFTVNVNIEPNTTAVFNLTYEELLVRRNKVYNHAINLHPGALVPKLTVTVHIKEAQKITALRVPEVRTGNEIDATEDDPQNSKAVIERGHDDREATITFKPDLDEQTRLMQDYAAKAKESQSHSSHSYWSTQEEEKAPEGVLGQFVVQYDVDRPKEGEILVNDGYFVHFFAPPDLPPLNKHVVFVLDTSGSMMDRKIVQLREAMRTILGELHAGDYFSIVEFATSVKVYDLKEAELEPPKRQEPIYLWEEKPATLVPPFPATPENIARAKTIVSRLSANGGTNIAGALKVAVELIQKSIDWKPEPTTPKPTKKKTTPLPNDADAPNSDHVDGPEPTEAAVEETTASAKLNVKENDVAKPKEERKLEPMIIFLTDGDPTIGETDPQRIINRLVERNYGDNKAAIFALAFGEDADRKFLRKLALRNDGFMRHIYEAADAALQLRDFYRQLASPLLAHLQFNYPKEQIKEGSLTKNKFRAYYGGSETVVAGRVADAVIESHGELAPSVIGICGVDDSFTRRKYEIFPKVPVASPREGYLPLERMWAYLTIKQLLDEKDAADDLNDEDNDKENTPEKKALKLALKYEFVTPLTSLVVVKPNATNAVDAQPVDKQDSNFDGVLMPAGLFAAGLPGAPPAYKAAFYSAVGPALSLASSAAVSPLISYEADDMVESEDYEHSAPTRLSFRSGSMDGHKVFASTHPYISFDLYASLPARAPAPFPTMSPSTTFRPPSRLEELHLQEFPWVEDLLTPGKDAIGLELDNRGNKTYVEAELTRDTDAPKEAEDEPCSRSTAGGEGVCVYLTRCDAARNIALPDYKRTFCLVDDKYAGICCPSSKVDVPKP